MSVAARIVVPSEKTKIRSTDMVKKNEPAKRLWLSVDFDFFVREDPSWDWGHRERPLFRDMLWEYRAQDLMVRGLDPQKEMSLERFARPKPWEFWSELERLGYDFSETSRVVVADSHLWAARTFVDNWPGKVQPGTRTLVHFDAHHDLAYSKDLARQCITGEFVDCTSWHSYVLSYWKHLKSKIVYPEWLGIDEWGEHKVNVEGTKWRQEIDNRVTAGTWGDKFVARSAGKVDVVFICRSGSWVPSWLDEEFVQFVKSLVPKTLAKKYETPFIEDDRCDPMVLRKKIDFDEAAVRARELAAMIKRSNENNTRLTNEPLPDTNVG